MNIHPQKKLQKETETPYIWIKVYLGKQCTSAHFKNNYCYFNPFYI